jgi:hypothetical protein
MPGVTVDEISQNPPKILQLRLETLPRRRCAAMFQAFPSLKDVVTAVPIRLIG